MTKVKKSISIQVWIDNYLQETAERLQISYSKAFEYCIMAKLSRATVYKFVAKHHQGIAHHYTLVYKHELNEQMVILEAQAKEKETPPANPQRKRKHLTVHDTKGVGKK